MKFSSIGRVATALFASLALGLGMTACGGGTIAYLWVIGQQYGQITGYQVDDYTGNLTQSPSSPYNAAGVNPISILVKPAGRFVYVINQGVAGTGSITTKSTSSGISVFSVGNQGVLTFQQTYQSQGQIPQWAQFDGTGSYLYVLDKFSPDGSGKGTITTFSVDTDTGRLTLVTNTTVKTTAFPAGVPYFNVGLGPTMMKTVGGCLMTLDAATNSVFPYSTGSGGQLNLTTTGEIAIQPGVVGTLSSINGNGSTVIFTDSAKNALYSYSIGGACALTPSNPSVIANTGTSSPVYTLIDNSSKYLYVLNKSATPGIGVAFSSISAYTIINGASQQLQPIAGAPYTVGSGPVCLVEDPTSQYIYVSNQYDGTVTGKVIDSTTGELSDLSRGSTFPASGVGACLAISGNI